MRVSSSAGSLKGARKRRCGQARRPQIPGVAYAVSSPVFAPRQPDLPGAGPRLAGELLPQEALDSHQEALDSHYVGSNVGSSVGSNVGIVVGIVPGPLAAVASYYTTDCAAWRRPHQVTLSAPLGRNHRPSPYRSNVHR